MSGSRSSNPPPKGAPGPRAALDALMAGSAADPIRRALWLDALDQRLRPHLPASLAAHARLANVNGDALVFLVDAPIWNARLRLAGPDLLQAAASLGLHAARLVIKTTTHGFEASPPVERPARAMSASTRDALQEALASLANPAMPVPDPDAPSRGDPSGDSIP